MLLTANTGVPQFGAALLPTPKGPQEVSAIGGGEAVPNKPFLADGASIAIFSKPQDNNDTDDKGKRSSLQGGVLATSSSGSFRVRNYRSSTETSNLFRGNANLDVNRDFGVATSAQSARSTPTWRSIEL